MIPDKPDPISPQESRARQERYATLARRRRHRPYHKTLGPRAHRDRLTSQVCYDRRTVDAIRAKLDLLAPGDPARVGLDARLIRVCRRLQARLRDREQLVQRHGLRTLVRIPRPDQAA